MNKYKYIYVYVKFQVEHWDFDHETTFQDTTVKSR